MSELYRLRFSKTGKARFISHLDLQHTIQRSFIRAGVPMKHTNGFNPHPYMSVALPLSVGCESLCELMDYEAEGPFLPHELPELLNPFLPEGIAFLEAYRPERKFKEIRWLEVEGVWTYDGTAPDPAELDRLFARETLVIEKKTKRGTAPTDILPAIDRISFGGSGKELVMQAVLSAQEPSLNPELLVRAVSVYAPEISPDDAAFCRKEIYDADHRIFR